MDKGREKGWWSQTGLRKIAVTISKFLTIPKWIGFLHVKTLKLKFFIIPSGCLPAMLFMSISLMCEDKYIVYGLLALSIMTSGMIFIGHLTNQNDLAPNYAGILMGITNTPGTIGAFLNPWLVAVMTKGIDVNNIVSNNFWVQ